MKKNNNKKFLEVRTGEPFFKKVLGRRRLIFLISFPIIGYLLFWLTLLVNPVSSQALHGFPESRRILDSQGRLLREVVNRDGARARWCDLKEISPLVVSATIAVEDARFYSHSGIDIPSVLRAIRQNTTTGRVVSGASTLTMQLSRLLYDHPHTMWGKLKQSYDALRLERTLSKDRILTQYLNRAFYGAGAVGIEAASQRYFGKPSLHLSLAEAALLAGLPKAPSNLNPLNAPKAARKRQRFVLKRMLEEGKIGLQEYKRAINQPLHYREQLPRLTAMHFTDYVLSQGPPAGDVVTTLDSGLQGQIESLVSDHVKALMPGGLTNASVVVLDNRDGGILAMVGSTGYWNTGGGSVNGALARRQPGSTLKPFTYALAFERGFTPASMVADIETQYLGRSGTLFFPKNYSEKFSGPVLIGEALGRSLNVPAIRVANALGVNSLLKRLRKAGFVSLDRDASHYGLGLTLGNGEITLLELAQGYAMFARGGRRCNARVFRDVLVETPVQVFPETICFLITDILSDQALRIRAFGSANPLLFDFPMAVKTGTSNNWRDNWVVGYTDRYTVAVWTGDFGGSPMNGISGTIGAGPLFHRVAHLVVHSGAVPRLPSSPRPPEGVKQVVVCSLSGMVPSEHCPNSCTVYVLKGDRPRMECSMHKLVRLDRRNGLLASGRCPSVFLEERVFEVLPPVYAQWQAVHKSPRPPVRYSPYCPPGGIVSNALVVTVPRDGEVYLLEPGYDRSTQTLRFSGEVDPVLPGVSWLVNGREVSVVGWPYHADWVMAKGRHTLVMKGGGMQSDPIKFEVR